METSKKILSYLDRMANSAKLPNSFLFVGIGDKAEEAAYTFISKIAGKSNDAEFLEKTKSKNHPDVVVVVPEVEEKKGKIREKEISIGQVRDALEHLKFFPYELEKKFCIVKKSQKMNIEAANALLKPLEEPSASAIFILLANAVDSILPTIVSRCTMIRFPQMHLPEWKEENREKLKSIFKEEIFEQFNYFENISKNKKEFILVLNDWEMIMAETLRRLVKEIGHNINTESIGPKIKKVVSMIEHTHLAINRLENTNATARSVGEELILDIAY